MTNADTIKLAEIGRDVKQIIKTLDGNGQKGLIRKVDENTNHRIESAAINETNENYSKKLFGGGIIFSMIMIGITLFNIFY